MILGVRSVVSLALFHSLFYLKADTQQKADSSQNNGDKNTVGVAFP